MVNISVISFIALNIEFQKDIFKDLWEFWQRTVTTHVLINENLKIYWDWKYHLFDDMKSCR